MFSGLLTELGKNLLFVLEFLAVVAVLLIAAYVVEKWEKKHNGSTERVLSTRKIAMIGMFSAIAAVLMFFEVPMPFAPNFYKIDLSELPVLIAAFAFGPVAGVLVEFVKIILNLITDSTTTAFVGELANFAVGCSFILPASIIYTFKKSKKQAIIACVAGTLAMTIFGSAFNAIYLLPKFAELYGMPLEAIVGMGTAINPAITDVNSLVLMAVVPLNVLKGSIVSLLTILIYKKLSAIIKAH